VHLKQSSMTLPIVPSLRDQQSWTGPRAILGGRYRASRKSGSGMQDQRYSWLTQRLFAGRPLKRHAPSGQAEEPEGALLSGVTSVLERPFLICDISICPLDAAHSTLRPQTNSPITPIVAGTPSATRSAASSCQSPAASGNGLRTPPHAKTFRIRRRPLRATAPKSRQQHYGRSAPPRSAHGAGLTPASKLCPAMIKG
jgi:hypothetical protein